MTSSRDSDFSPHASRLLKTASDVRSPFHRRGRWAMLGLALVLAIVASLGAGAPVPVADLFSSQPARADVARAIFLELRPVRLACALLVGGALAVSGASLQTLFRNPLAEPYLLGLSAGGALGATLAVALRLPALGPFDGAAGPAFAGSLGASWLVYRLGQGSADGSRPFDRSRLLLSGVALSSFGGAATALVVSLSTRDDLAQQTMFWLLGSLTRATLEGALVLAGSVVLGVAVLLSGARDLNALRAGDEEAASLGVRVEAVQKRLLVAASLMTACAVAAAGLIGFVGLIAPHIARQAFGGDARSLLPASLLGGAALLAGCDAVARSAASPVELPVGIITALLGVPLFLVLARR